MSALPKFGGDTGGALAPRVATGAGRQSSLKERVSDRFERERPLLLPLAPHGYRFVTPRPMPEESGDADVAPAEAPAVDVEKRPLAYYADRRRGS